MPGRGRGRKRTRSLARIICSKKRISSGPAEQEAESNLPADILRVILSRLSLDDNVRASSVCKRWYAAAASVRKADRPPWLLSVPKSGDLFGFYNPSDRKTYYLKFPKLENCTICYAKFGWLLMYKPRTERVFFFHPYTQQVIKFPKLHLMAPTVAFSAPPTSPSCVLFALSHVTPIFFRVCACRAGDTEWTSTNFGNQLPFVSGIWNNVVVWDGLFYCLSLTGWLGIYDPEKITWNMYPHLRLPERLIGLDADTLWKWKYLCEHNGDIYVVYACSTLCTVVCKLNEAKNEWQEVTDLGSMTIFASYLTTCVKTDLLGNMRNKVYFPKVQFYGKRCINYSLRDQRYYPRKNGLDLWEEEFVEHIWVDPPKDVSIFL